VKNDPIICEIRCPVHGFVGLTEFERRIVDTPEFQRLRRIKQLSWTDYIYPGATHSRFEHSLGVMQVATRLFDAIVDTSDTLLRRVYSYNDTGFARSRQIVRLAALLHDIGHPPFSHATETLLPMKAVGQLALIPGHETRHSAISTKITPSQSLRVPSRTSFTRTPQTRETLRLSRMRFPP
jgi:HD superfamily phosphohydrolase